MVKRKRRMRRINGTLLLEVLVAAAVLSIGILACLNVFSSSIYAGSRLKEVGMVGRWRDETFFEQFLDPTGVSLETGGRTLPTEQKVPYEARILTELMNPEEETVPEGQENPPTIHRVVQQPWSVEFFDTKFTVDATKRKSHYQFNQILFRYDQQRRQPKKETK